LSVFAGERIVVIGLGVAGRAVATVLAEEGATVRVSEARPDAEGTPELRARGVEIVCGGHEPGHLDGATAIVPSPGVPEHAPVLGWARSRGIPIWSELDVGARLCTVPFVAITGTNGKSTTTKLVAEMMREAGLDAVACGNIGHPFCVAAREGHQALAVETSSFQLRFHRWVHPSVSVLLNIAPDHLDWHGSMDAYRAAKTRIFELQREDDVHVGNAEDPEAAAISRQAPCRTVWFRRGAPSAGETGVVEGEVVARGSDGSESALGRPRFDPAGYVSDCVAAASAAVAFGLPPDAIARGMASMTPLPHRGEEVARVAGVRFLDDSKATNVHAALHALEGKRDVVLIAGGLAKGVDLAPLASASGALAGVVAIGEAAEEIVALFAGRIPALRSGSIEDAVRAAYRLAPPGGSVLLAPACASWDMFRDYVERGDRFATAARGLAREVARVDP